MEKTPRETTVAVLWEHGPVAGSVDVVYGHLASLALVAGRGRVDGHEVDIAAGGAARLLVRVADARVQRGARATRVQLRMPRSPIAFFLRDVSAETPIHVPEYGLAVTTADDPRDYAGIVAAIRGRGVTSGLARIEAEPEETFEAAAARTRDMKCPTWLGLARDMRIFRVMHDELGGTWGMIVRSFPLSPGRFGQTDEHTYNLNFMIGPGPSCRARIARWLDERVLPILHSTQDEGDVVYHLTAFATLETRPLSADAVRGSDWRAAYDRTYGNMYTDDDRRRLADLIVRETAGREEEVVCCVRVEAVNNGAVPRYAWLKALRMSPCAAQTFDGRDGFASAGPDRIFGIHRLDGAPMPDEEMAVLLQPGERLRFEMLIPHEPLSADRARRLAGLDLDAHLSACRDYWRRKLASAAGIRVPEPAIDERIRAGLLHLDLITLGLEPDGSALACIGGYPPIGSESSPIIQFFDSMGWHELAERSIRFFLDRQRSDGMIQNFGAYEIETGAVLWTAGEHFRYTRDLQWVAREKPRLLKSCEFLLRWREKNRKPEFRGMGYGLVAGKVADPEDFYRSFMLNGVACAGLQRVAEMLGDVDPSESRRLASEAEAFKQDIRLAYREAIEQSPLVPLGDGTWAPAPPPWAEYRGPVCLYAEGGRWCYGTFSCNDSLIGPLYLVLTEMLGPSELGATFLLKAHQELMTVDNAALGQPYYSRHDFLHLKRGEVKPYLKTFYNQLTSLQDRETYTFWECYTHGSQHKTHEEGWFLMQARWMLYLEEGDGLSLLKAIPRRWLEDGKSVALDRVASYFGPLSFKVESEVKHGRITARVECRSDRAPRRVTIRLPHPDGRRPVAVEGGDYDAPTETVRIAPFSGAAEVSLSF